MITNVNNESPRLTGSKDPGAVSESRPTPLTPEGRRVLAEMVIDSMALQRSGRRPRMMLLPLEQLLPIAECYLEKGFSPALAKLRKSIPGYPERSAHRSFTMMRRLALEIVIDGRLKAIYAKRGSHDS